MFQHVRTTEMKTTRAQHVSNFWTLSFLKTKRTPAQGPRASAFGERVSGEREGDRGPKGRGEPRASGESRQAPHPFPCVRGLVWEDIHECPKCERVALARFLLTPSNQAPLFGMARSCQLRAYRETAPIGDGSPVGGDMIQCWGNSSDRCGVLRICLKLTLRVWPNQISRRFTSSPCRLQLTGGLQLNLALLELQTRTTAFS